MNPPNQRRRWRSFLIDSGYQVSFALPVVTVAAALFVGLGGVAVQKLDTATKVGLNEVGAEGVVVAVSAETREALTARAARIRWGIAGGGVLLTAGLLLFGIRMTHRVAGPLRRIAVELEALGQGKLAAPRGIRRGDLLGELYEKFGVAVEALRQREREEIAVWRQIAAAAALDPALRDHAAVRRMLARLQDKEQSLG
ncbi:MAG: hypothetical protein HY903_09210 [Deltaproteobacteria bacterium]|nr:hypothetical protein [Deltaproteobacteria bacterium]